MTASYNDSYFLSQDPTFQNRVRAALVFNALTIGSEAWSVAFHRERQTYASQILNSPDTYKLIFANAAAVNATCLADATQAGTVPLTSGNASAQGALVTDPHIDAAITAFFNTFFRVPSS